MTRISCHWGCWSAQVCESEVKEYYARKNTWCSRFQSPGFWGLVLLVLSFSSFILGPSVCTLISQQPSPRVVDFIPLSNLTPNHTQFQRVPFLVFQTSSISLLTSKCGQWEWGLSDSKSRPLYVVAYKMQSTEASGWISGTVSFLSFFFLTFIYFWETERGRTWAGEEERERDTGSEAGSGLWAVC